MGRSIYQLFDLSNNLSNDPSIERSFYQTIHPSNDQLIYQLQKIKQHPTSTAHAKDVQHSPKRNLWSKMFRSTIELQQVMEKLRKASSVKKKININKTDDDPIQSKIR